MVRVNQRFVQSQTIQLLQASCSKWEMKSSTGNSVLVTSDYNNQYTCMQIVHQLECVHLFVPCGNEPGQKSFRHLQMHFFRSNGGMRKIKRSSMSLHSLMQSRRSRARRRIRQRGSSVAAASSTLVPLIYTLSTASVAASPWNITRKAYKETVRKIRSVCLILDVLTRFCSCQCLESNELLEVRTSGVFLDWECNR